MTVTSLDPVSQYVRERIAGLLEERRVVVWFDGEHAFGDLVERLDPPNEVVGLTVIGMKDRLLKGIEAPQQEVAGESG